MRCKFDDEIDKEIDILNKSMMWTRLLIIAAIFCIFFFGLVSITNSFCVICTWVTERNFWTFDELVLMLNIACVWIWSKNFKSSRRNLKDTIRKIYVLKHDIYCRFCDNKIDKYNRFFDILGRLEVCEKCYGDMLMSYCYKYKEQTETKRCPMVDMLTCEECLAKNNNKIRKITNLGKLT